MELACAALTGLFADEVAFARAALANRDVMHIAAYGDDFPREFMACYKRRWHCALCPVIPIPDVQIGSADACLVDFDEHVFGADLGHGLLLKRDAGRWRSFDEGLHGVFHGWAFQRSVERYLRPESQTTIAIVPPFSLVLSR